MNHKFFLNALSFSQSMKEIDTIDLRFFNWISRDRMKRSGLKNIFRNVFFWIFIFKKYSLVSKGKKVDIVGFYSNENESNVILPILSAIKQINSELLVGELYIEKKYSFSLILLLPGIIYAWFYFLLRRQNKLDIKLKALVYYHLSKKFLVKLGCKVVVQSNDHNLINNCFLYAAKQLNVKTCYVQHAHVSSIFPPLRHDICCLDGQIALDIYRSIGIEKNTVIKLTGCQRKYKIQERNDAKIPIGVGLTPNDDLDQIFSVFCEILNEYNVIVRVHPRHRQSINIQRFLEEGFKLSPLPLQDFLNSISFLFSSPSSLILDASVNKINCCQIERSSILVEDYYGFHQNSLCDTIDLESKNILEFLRGYNFKEFHFLDGLYKYDSSSIAGAEPPSAQVAKELINIIRD